MQPTRMSTPAPGAMMHGYGQSMYPTGVASLPGHMQEVIFSGKHNGICIYLSRILRYVKHLNKMLGKTSNHLHYLFDIGSGISYACNLKKKKEKEKNVKQ